MPTVLETGSLSGFPGHYPTYYMTRLKHSVQDLEQRVAPLHHLLGPGGGGPLHSPHPRRGPLDQQTVPAVRGGVRAAVRTLPGRDKTVSRDEYQEVNQEKLPVLVWQSEGEEERRRDGLHRVHQGPRETGLRTEKT